MIITPSQIKQYAKPVPSESEIVDAFVKSINTAIKSDRFVATRDASGNTTYRVNIDHTVYIDGVPCPFNDSIATKIETIFEKYGWDSCSCELLKMHNTDIGSVLVVKWGAK